MLHKVITEASALFRGEDALVRKIMYSSGKEISFLPDKLEFLLAKPFLANQDKTPR